MLIALVILMMWELQLVAAIALVSSHAKEHFDKYLSVSVSLMQIFDYRDMGYLNICVYILQYVCPSASAHPKAHALCVCACMHLYG